jgi:phospholipid transport system substrate-binding protein
MKVHSSNPSMTTRPIGRRLLIARAAAGMMVAAMTENLVPARAAGSDDPTTPIQRLNASLLAAMEAGQNTPFAQRFAMLSPAVEYAFELNALLRGAVGLGWDSMSEDQQAALASTFQRYTVSNYTANFDTYEGQSFRVLPETRALPNGSVVVRTQLVRPSKSPIEIDYVMRQRAAGWKAVDVLSDGTISQVAAQRSDFRSLLASGGSAALRAGLERKVAMLSNGAMA